MTADRDDAVEIIQVKGGFDLRLRVKPGGRRDRLVGAHGGALKVEVRAAPERGRANLAVEQLLARELGLARSEVEITTGSASQDKRVRLVGCSAEGLVERLARSGVLAWVRTCSRHRDR
jgi:uncharacterized protein YggU (UPF0235/DUF167 family)